MIGIDIGLFMMRHRGWSRACFGWPGIGQLAWQAIQRVDLPIIMASRSSRPSPSSSATSLADLVSPFVDPRIKLN